MNVSSECISVVVQGVFSKDKHNGGEHCLDSIRKFLPYAEIVVSTWEYVDTSWIDADIIVKLKEPSAFYDFDNKINNVCRLILSSRSGIEAATRQYILKFRPDLFLISETFCVIGRNFEKCSNNYRIFKEKITTTNLFLPNAIYDPTLFHVPDIVQFGLRDDMLNFWDIKLPQHEDIYNNSRNHAILGNFSGSSNLRMLPEQVITTSWLLKNGFNVKLKHINQSNCCLLKCWEGILITNFNILDWKSCGIIFPNRFFETAYGSRSFYLQKDINNINDAINHKRYVMRYIYHYVNKYILCWFKRGYIFSVFLILLSRFQILQPLKRGLGLWRRNLKKLL